MNRWYRWLFRFGSSGNIQIIHISDSDSLIHGHIVPVSFNRLSDISVYISINIFDQQIEAQIEAKFDSPDFLQG